MKINYNKQSEVEELDGKEIDLFLLAGNHEKRVFAALDKISSSTSISKTIIFCYEEFKCKKPHNKIQKLKINQHIEIYKVLDEELLSNTKEEINIVVDYSCMTKSWYYSIMLYLSNKNLKQTSIKVYFVYTPSKYSQPQSPKPNTEIGPLPGKYIIPTDKPKALIVCLGYEQNKAEGIIEHLDPKISYIFYSKPALDAKFVDTLERNNASILKDESKNVMCYPLDDLLFLERELTKIYYKVKDDYSIIIAPLGPKPFTFIAMLLSVKYDDIDIWRVGSGSDINIYKREPIENTFIVSEVGWEKNNYS